MGAGQSLPQTAVSGFCSELLHTPTGLPILNSLGGKKELTSTAEHHHMLCCAVPCCASSLETCPATRALGLSPQPQAPGAVPAGRAAPPKCAWFAASTSCRRVCWCRMDACSASSLACVASLPLLLSQRLVTPQAPPLSPPFVLFLQEHALGPAWPGVPWKT